MKTNQKTVLEAINLCKSYQGTPVVRGVSIKLKQGKIVGLLGPNGAGKTTCFHMLIGLESPDSGTLMLGDRDISRLAIHERVRCGLGYLPQEPSVFRKLSVEDNLLAVLETRAQFNKQQRHGRCTQLLEEFGLSALRHNLAEVLSGGERRRLEIARTLALEPSFILLDEPFAGVDPIAVDGVKQWVAKLCSKGIGVLITDHNVREALDLCDYAYVLYNGTVFAEGTTAAIMKNKKVIDIYLGDSFRPA